MARKGALVIKDWQRGMGYSSFTGFGEMRGVDPFTVPGILRTVPGSTSVGGSSVTSKPTKIVYDATSGYYYLNQTNNDVKISTNSGDTWLEITGETVSSGGGNGLEIWNDYLFHFRDSAVDVYGPLSGSPSWSNSWAGASFSYTTANALRPTVVGQDGIMYIADGQYVASLKEIGTFSPGTPGTYTFTAQALDLPTGQTITAMAERGTWLLIGTNKGIIYPWDRLSQSFFMPIDLGEAPVHAMLTKDDLTYVWAGPRCQMYVTDGKSARKVALIPEDTVTDDEGSAFSDGTALSMSPFSVMVHDGKIKFGRNDQYGANGIWSYNNGKLVLENIASTGSSGSGNAQINVGAVFPIGSIGNYLWGYRYVDADANISYKLDKKSSAASSVGYVKSPWYRVGDHLTTRTFTGLRLTTTGNASGTVTISYRTKNGASFTTCATLSVSSTQPSYYQPITITAEILQLKIAISGSCEVYECVLET